MKCMMRSRKTDEEEDLGTDDQIDFKMSVVGRKMTERITKKGNETCIFDK